MHHSLIEGDLDAHDVGRAVRHLGVERPDWVPVLQAACECAQAAEQYGGELAGTSVLGQLRSFTPATSMNTRVPGLRTLLAYGLVERVGSDRRGRRAYYLMPKREAVEPALAEIGRPVPEVISPLELCP